MWSGFEPAVMTAAWALAWLAVSIWSWVTTVAHIRPPDGGVAGLARHCSWNARSWFTLAVACWKAT
jgi:hypothetical protein